MCFCAPKVGLIGSSNFLVLPERFCAGAEERPRIFVCVKLPVAHDELTIHPHPEESPVASQFTFQGHPPKICLELSSVKNISFGRTVIMGLL